MKIWYDHGIHLKMDDKYILLDPFKKMPCKPDFVIVSHGHWDHASGLKDAENLRMIMHPATYDYKKDYISTSNKIIRVQNGDTIDINGLKIECARSGHCLGSLQFKITGRKKTVVFTGDLNYGGTYSEAPCEVLSGDVLIIESNFGSPEYVFPDRLTVLGRLGKWIYKYINEKPIVLFSHALGKTQELTHFLNDMDIIQSGGNGARCNLFMKHLGVFTNKLFERYRFRFDNRYRLHTKGIELDVGEILIYPIRDKPSISQMTETKRRLNLLDAAFGYVSGWTLNKRGDFYFPVSSHSGFNELVEYTEKSSPEKVYSFHGFAETFASELTKRGFDATGITVDDSFD